MLYDSICCQIFFTDALMLANLKEVMLSSTEIFNNQNEDNARKFA